MDKTFHIIKRCKAHKKSINLDAIEATKELIASQEEHKVDCYITPNDKTIFTPENLKKANIAFSNQLSDLEKNYKAAVQKLKNQKALFFGAAAIKNAPITIGDEIQVIEHHNTRYQHFRNYTHKYIAIVTDVSFVEIKNNQISWEISAESTQITTTFPQLASFIITQTIPSKSNKPLKHEKFFIKESY